MASYNSWVVSVTMSRLSDAVEAVRAICVAAPSLQRYAHNLTKRTIGQLAAEMRQWYTQAGLNISGIGMLAVILYEGEGGSGRIVAIVDVLKGTGQVQ